MGHELEAYCCPECGNNCADSMCPDAPAERKPAPGDYVMCKCHRFFVVNEDLSLRELTENDWDQVFKDDPRDYLRMRLLQKQYPPIEKGPPDGDQNQGASGSEPVGVAD